MSISGGFLHSPTEIEELRLKAPRPVATPEGPTSCPSEPIGLLRAVDPPSIFVISLSILRWGSYCPLKRDKLQVPLYHK